MIFGFRDIGDLVEVAAYNSVTIREAITGECHRRSSQLGTVIGLAVASGSDLDFAAGNSQCTIDLIDGVVVGYFHNPTSLHTAICVVFGNHIGRLADRCLGTNHHSHDGVGSSQQADIVSIAVVGQRRAIVHLLIVISNQVNHSGVLRNGKRTKCLCDIVVVRIGTRIRNNFETVRTLTCV